MTESGGQAKICGVCGDKALAKNFSALSCESCKAFFRRNASKLNRFICFYDQKCPINCETRKICRKCRLKKCFEIGMREDWILNENERKVRNIKRQSNREKRQKDSINSCSSHEMVVTSDDGISYDSNDILAQILEDNAITDEDIDHQMMQIESIETNEISDDVYEMAAEFELSVIPIPRPLTEFNPYLNETEGNHLMELSHASQVLKSIIPSITSQAFSFLDAVKVMVVKSDEEIRNIIKMSKNLRAFRNICENDQISLVKYSCIEIIIMRSVVAYDREKEYWSIPLDEYNSVLLDLKLLKYKEHDLYVPQNRFLQQMHSEWESDETLLDLLTAIILFNPNRPNLIHKEMVKLQQHVYMHLLQRYLMVRYRSECQAKTKFMKLINTSIAVRNLHENNYKIFIEGIPSNISPLFNEVCDVLPENTLEIFNDSMV